MPGVCSICSHPDRAAIERDLLRGELSVRAIATHYNVGRSSLSRHRDNHIIDFLAQSEQAHEVVQADRLLDQVQELHGRALGLLDKAEASDNIRTAVAAVREVRGVLELLGKVQGELSNGPQINISIHPQWVQIKNAVITALDGFPQAKSAVIHALEGVNAG